MFERGNFKASLFTAVIVGIIVLLIENFVPDINLSIRIIIVAISALIGGFIGSSLFSKKN